MDFLFFLYTYWDINSVVDTQTLSVEFRLKTKRGDVIVLYTFCLKVTESLIWCQLLIRSKSFHGIRRMKEFVDRCQTGTIWTT